MDLNTLLNILHSPEYILHRFARQMEVQLNMLTGKGVEGLLDLFDNVGRLMKPTLDHSLSLPALNKNSVLGLYIRRVIIFFEKLPFDQVVALYEALKKYLDKRINTFDGSDISTDSKTENLYSNEYVFVIFMNCNLLFVCNLFVWICILQFLYTSIELKQHGVEDKLNYLLHNRHILYKQMNIKQCLLQNCKVLYENF